MMIDLLFRHALDDTVGNARRPRVGIWMGAVDSESRHEINVPLGYLRGFLVLLVVAHRSALAYGAITPAQARSFAAPPMLWRAIPIVNAAHNQALQPFDSLARRRIGVRVDLVGACGWWVQATLGPLRRPPAGHLGDLLLEAIIAERPAAMIPDWQSLEGIAPKICSDPNSSFVQAFESIGPLNCVRYGAACSMG